MVFLHAGVPFSSSWKGGQWFEITSLKDPNLGQDEQIHGLKEHVKHIREQIEAEISAGIPEERIALIGLSQGCAQSLFTLLTMSLESAGSSRLGAVIGMSGWLPPGKHSIEFLTRLHQNPHTIIQYPPSMPSRHYNQYVG